MTGNIKRTTTNYGFRIPYFDRTGWGREMERNFDVVDAALFATTGLGGIVGTWTNSTEYNAADRVVDPTDGTIWVCNIDHVSAGTGTFAQARTDNPTYWTAVTTSFAYRGQWITGTQYNVNDIVFNGYSWALARLRYVSGASFAADLADNKLTLLFDGTATVTAAQLAETNAETAQSAAEFAQTQAQNAATGAGASAGAASTSAAQALAFRNTAETHKNDAATSASAAAGSATAASGSATTATTQATNASNSATAAAGSAATATTKATESQNYSIYSWEQAQLAVAAVNSVGYLAQFRNKISNPEFLFWHRAISQNTSGYASVDRYSLGMSGSSCTISRQAHTAGQTAVPGEPRNFLRAAFTSVAGANNYVILTQPIEMVNTLQGQTATVTFWAKADVAGKRLGIELEQIFGVGGSTAVQGIASQYVTLTTSWQKYSILITIPPIAGRVIGSANDCLRFSFWFDAGSTFNARSGNMGQQSGTIDISNLSLVAGDARNEPNPTSPRSISQENNICQRYLSFVAAHLRYYSAGAGAVHEIGLQWTEMRINPTANLFAAGNITNASSVTLNSMSTVGCRYAVTANAAGDCYSLDRYYFMDAEL